MPSDAKKYVSEFEVAMKESKFFSRWVMDRNDSLKNKPEFK
jgi:hypothetical protein